MRSPRPASALAALFAKPASPRTAAHSRHLDIIVSRPGHPAHTVRVDLDLLRRVLLGISAAAALWLGVTVYMAWNQANGIEAQREARRLAAHAAQVQSANARLQAENGALTNTLIGLKQRVDGIANAVRGFVQERAREFPIEHRPQPQGGIAQPLTPAQVSVLLGAEATRIEDRLALLQPQVEQLVAREAARPMGLPLAGDPRVTSDYGLRSDPFGHGVEFHNGIDFDAPMGTPVHATADGVVQSAGWRAGYGNCVIIDHPFGYRSLYGHLEKIEVRPGQPVSRGQVIALSGNTGRSTGPHLHYTLFYGDKTIDPAPYALTLAATGAHDVQTQIRQIR